VVDDSMRPPEGAELLCCSEGNSEINVTVITVMECLIKWRQLANMDGGTAERQD